MREIEELPQAVQALHRAVFLLDNTVRNLETNIKRPEPLPLPDWGVKIIEIYPMTEQDPRTEYLVIHNDQDAQVDMTGWWIGPTGDGQYLYELSPGGNDMILTGDELETVWTWSGHWDDFYIGHGSGLWYYYPCASLYTPLPERLEVSRYCHVFPQVHILGVDVDQGRVLIKNAINMTNPIKNWYMVVDSQDVYVLPFIKMNGYWEYTLDGFTLPSSGCIDLYTDLDLWIHSYCY